MKNILAAKIGRRGFFLRKSGGAFLAISLALLCTLTACAKAHHESSQTLTPQAGTSSAAVTSAQSSTGPGAGETTLASPKTEWKNRHWEDLSLRVRNELGLQDEQWDNAMIAPPSPQNIFDPAQQTLILNLNIRDASAYKDNAFLEKSPITYFCKALFTYNVQTGRIAPIKRFDEPERVVAALQGKGGLYTVRLDNAADLIARVREGQTSEAQVYHYSVHSLQAESDQELLKIRIPYTACQPILFRIDQRIFMLSLASEALPTDAELKAERALYELSQSGVKKIWSETFTLHNEGEQRAIPGLYLLNSAGGAAFMAGHKSEKPLNVYCFSAQTNAVSAHAVKESSYDYLLVGERLILAQSDAAGHSTGELYDPAKKSTRPVTLVHTLERLRWQYDEGNADRVYGQGRERGAVLVQLDEAAGKLLYEAIELPDNGINRMKEFKQRYNYVLPLPGGELLAISSFFDQDYLDKRPKEADVGPFIIAIMRKKS